MPRYTSPGVYVEEYRERHSITSVDASVAAFVGPTRSGPISGRPELLRSTAEFERTYGDAADLVLGDGPPVTNHMALAVRGFFAEGGSSVYVVRILAPSIPASPAADHAGAVVTNPDDDAQALKLRSRFPGRAGTLRVTFTLRVGDNALAQAESEPSLIGVSEFDTVWARTDATLSRGSVRVVRGNGPMGWQLSDGTATVDLADVQSVHPLSVSIEVERPTPGGTYRYAPPDFIGEFGFNPHSVHGGISTVLSPAPPTGHWSLTAPVFIDPLEGLFAPSADADPDAVACALATTLFGAAALATATDAATVPTRRRVTLQGGNDGRPPDAATYAGDEGGSGDGSATAPSPTGLRALEPLGDVSILAVPGASSAWVSAAEDIHVRGGRTEEIHRVVIDHCERMRHLVAVLDTPVGLQPAAALRHRALITSNRAALHYPWLTVWHPVTGEQVSVPPSGWVAAVLARAERTRAMTQPAADRVLRSVSDVEARLTPADFDQLTPAGLNCLRLVPSTGVVLWGARTISDDPTWRYLSVRRYVTYLESSIDRGTGWATFEANSPALWGEVRRTVEDFLTVEWRSGALQGTRPEQAFFVRCDDSTMALDDVNSGRLICMVGVAVIKPAEFVIFHLERTVGPAD